MPNRITGIYSANDGGFYYVRFVGSSTGGQVFWFGENQNSDFSNVMVGELNVFPGGDFGVENGRWWDVPKGRARGASSASRPETLLELQIEGNEIRKSLDSGVGFGGTQWSKISTRPTQASINLSGFSGEGVTGVWLGNDGGVYYVRQTGSDIAWFGEACSPPGTATTFANVYVGSVSGSNVTGSWADVPYGGTTAAGNLSLRIEGDRMIRTGVTGGFGGSLWTRSRISASTIISALQVTITAATGIDSGRRPDGLRGGSVDYGVVELSRGRTLPKVNLNEGRALEPGDFDTTIIALPPGTRRDELVSFTLEHDGAPRNIPDTYDNWDVGRVEISFKIDGTTCPGQLVVRSGQPFVRLDGERPSVKIPIPPLS